jgi:hypothetical protein
MNKRSHLNQLKVIILKKNNQILLGKFTNYLRFLDLTEQILKNESSKDQCKRSIVSPSNFNN